jgi:class 3 adenylate cyclase
MSMISFLKIIAALKRARKLVKYSNHQGLNARMPGFEVKMGYGLHVGWAIEGAIGSFYKIDASYLSPNVNMASRLEGATKQFGVPLLISGELFDYFTPECQAVCRQIDCVEVGTPQPLRLYTVDVLPDHLELEQERAPMTPQQKKKERVKERLTRDRYRT